MDKYTEKHHDVILNYSINKNKAVASIKKKLKRTTVKVTTHGKKARNQREKNQLPNNEKMEANQDRN